MLTWYVAKVKRGDLRPEQYLHGQGVPVYSPEIVLVKGGKQRTERLFPGYVFVQADPDAEDWPLIRWAPGLSYFLPTSIQPEPVADTMIQEISSRVQRWNSGGWVEAFRPGDNIVVGAGPLKQLDAIFQRYVPGRQRCEVILSLFGGPRRIQLEISEIQGAVMRQRFAQGV